MRHTLLHQAATIAVVMEMSEFPDEVERAYNAWVYQYDTNSNATRDLNAEVPRRQPFELTGKQVLEIGCGTGLNTIWLADRVQCVVGMDISAGMLNKAHSRLQGFNTYVLQADITKPCPLSHTFDAIRSPPLSSTLSIFRNLRQNIGNENPSDLRPERTADYDLLADYIHQCHRHLCTRFFMAGLGTRQSPYRRGYPGPR